MDTKIEGSFAYENHGQVMRFDFQSSGYKINLTQDGSGLGLEIWKFRDFGQIWEITKKGLGIHQSEFMLTQWIHVKRFF